MRMRVSNRNFQAAIHADAAASRKYQSYAESLLHLEALKSTSPDGEEPISVSEIAFPRV